MSPDGVEAYTGLAFRVLGARAFLQDAVGFLANSFKSKVFKLSAVVFSHLSSHNESNLVGLLTSLRY